MVSKRGRLRLSLALGSWQAVAWGAALSAADDALTADAPADAPDDMPDDVLLLYETGPVSLALARAMRDVAAAVRPAGAVGEAYDLLGDVPRRIGQAELDRRVAGLRARVAALAGWGDDAAAAARAADAVGEVWLCRITRLNERLVLRAFPRARVQLYEDGVLSYLATREGRAPVADDRGVVAALRGPLERRWPALRLRRFRHGLDPQDAARLAGFWSILGGGFALPPALAGVPRHDVPVATLRAAVAACADRPAMRAFTPAPRERPAVLVLGQALSRFHALPRAVEARVYADAVAQVLDRGYDVWWKEHPRAGQPFLDDVARGHAAGRVLPLELPFALPVELVAGRLHLAACVGGMTTALFYLPLLEGIAAHTFAPQLANALTGDWALQNAFIQQRVAPLSALPAVS